jgi:predicted dinucleotide-binding enzyme
MQLFCDHQSLAVIERIFMKIGILGTGMVGETLGTKFVQLGHQVRMGSRTANNENAAKWVSAAGTNASQGTFADAAAFGEMIFVCLKGEIVLDVVRSVAGSLAGKTVVDVSNPLDFSKGMPPSLSICNTSSLGEEMQKAVPAAKVVKTLNIVNCGVMVDGQRRSSDDAALRQRRGRQGQNYRAAAEYGLEGRDRSRRHREVARHGDAAAAVVESDGSVWSSGLWIQDRPRLILFLAAVGDDVRRLILI